MVRTSFGQGHQRGSPSTRVEDGFSLVEMLIALLLFAIMLSMVGVDIVTYSKVGISTNRALRSENEAQLVASTIERYLPFAVPACGMAPFLSAVEDPTEYAPINFTAAVGPNLSSPPEDFALWLQQGASFEGVRSYTVMLAETPVPSPCTGFSEHPYTTVSDRTVTFRSIAKGNLRSKLLLDEAGITANPLSAGSPLPPFYFCSVPGVLSGGSYSVTGSDLTDLSSPPDGSVPFGTTGIYSPALASIAAVRMEITARVGTAPATNVVTLLRLYNYPEYAPVQPSVTSQACPQ